MIATNVISQNMLDAPYSNDDQTELKTGKSPRNRDSNWNRTGMADVNNVVGGKFHNKDLIPRQILTPHSSAQFITPQCGAQFAETLSTASILSVFFLFA
ncbi:hypothetical protein CDAR_527001 [Caerostris darwini]|uniref:Uncharacterized protein n=1 Tax=Caerostris darwini TaxID=1538125 RepID=A0AAV4WKW4_9ARAC|nr:hypothetical protein CDAR_527001 [Caerostris darwini]